MLMTVALLTTQRMALCGARSNRSCRSTTGNMSMSSTPEMKAERREVKIGARQPGFVEIISGLRRASSVVVDGTIRLRPGATVALEAPKEERKGKGAGRAARACARDAVRSFDQTAGLCDGHQLVDRRVRRASRSSACRCANCRTSIRRSCRCRRPIRAPRRPWSKPGSRSRSRMRSPASRASTPSPPSSRDGIFASHDHVPPVARHRSGGQRRAQRGVARRRPAARRGRPAGGAKGRRRRVADHVPATDVDDDEPDGADRLRRALHRRSLVDGRRRGAGARRSARRGRCASGSTGWRWRRAV